MTQNSPDPDTLSSQVELDPGVGFHDLGVSEVIDETPDSRSFVLDVPAALAETFRYRAGQFLTFRIPWEGFEITRCYSLASSPDAGELPKVTVKRVADGRVSNWFNEHLSAGDRLWVRPPAGAFVLRSSDAPIVLFSGGSGITPIISLIKTALITTSRRMKLIYANRDEGSIIFRDELHALTARHPDRLEIVHHLDEQSGFLTSAALQGLISGWESAEFYICGPTPYMDAVEEALEAKGIERARIFIERFVSAVDPDRRPEAAPAPAASAEALPSAFRMTLEAETHDVPYSKGKTLLECAKEAGLEPPYSCEEGYCSCCMAILKEGEVVMAVNDALSQKDLEAGYVLTCQSRPVTPKIWVDYDF